MNPTATRLSGRISGLTARVFTSVTFTLALLSGLPNAAARERERKLSPEKVVARKLQEIVVPELDCRQADVRVVIRLLADLSRELDPEKKGVNIVCGFGSAVPREAEDGKPKYDLSFGETAVPTVTFTARQISLGEALKIVCQLSGLKYRLEGSVVLVLPQNAPEGEIIVRWYDVLPVIEERIQALRHERLKGPWN